MGAPTDVPMVAPGASDRDLLIQAITEQRATRAYLAECRERTEKRFDELRKDIKAQDQRIGRRLTREEFEKHTAAVDKANQHRDETVRELELGAAAQRQTVGVLKYALGALGIVIAPFIGWVLTHLHWV